MNLIKRVEFVDCEGEGEILTGPIKAADSDQIQSDLKGYTQRCSD